MSPYRSVLAVAVALAVLALMGGASASGAATGVNGLIAYQCITNGGLQTDICVVDPATGAVANLTNDPVDDASPAWSPDGAQIVFDSFRSTNQPNIHVMNADGAGIRRISATPCCERDFEPSWSPDGSRIAFVSTRDGDGESEIYVMDATGELGGAEAIRLTDDPEVEFGQGINDSQITWSPDSKRLAFVSNRDPADPDTCDLWVMDAEDGNDNGFGDHLTRLTFDNDYECEITSPSWSPTGSRIAYTSTRSGDYEIWVINANGSNPVNVTNFPGMDFSPGWSPDGTMITFVSGRSGSYQIWSIAAPSPAARSVPTSTATQITQTGTNLQPSWGARKQTGPRSTIAKPSQGSTYARRKLTRFRGTATGAGPQVAEVKIALRQELADGTCTWWTGAAFVADGCQQYLWIKAAGVLSWSYQLRKKLPRSTGQVARYTRFSQARDTSGAQESSFLAGRNANTFQIT